MTFSIAARDENGWLGFATSSKALAAGAAGECVKRGVGVIASQAFANPYLTIDGMQLLQDGMSAEEVVDQVIESDVGRDLRQLGIVDHGGRAAAYTGESCIQWAGHVIGDGYVCLGNILEGEGVVKAMAKVFELSADDPLYERLVLALEAGQAAGGDRRGRQAAAVRILADEEYLFCDLRVDDHPDPVAELRRILELFKEKVELSLATRPRRHNFMPNREALVRRRDAIERELDQRVEAHASERAGEVAHE